MGIQAKLTQQGAKRTYFGMSGSSFLTLAVAWLGWTLVNFDSATFQLTYPLIQKELGISDAMIGYLYSLAYLVSFLAVLAAGPLMDRFGRRIVFITTLWGTAIGSVLSGVAASFVQLTIFRSIVGAGASTEMSTGQVMVGETQDSKRRNFIIGVNQTGYPVGFFMAALLTKLVVPHFGWRAVYFIGFIPILVVLLMRSRVGETERFLDVDNVRKEAKKIAEAKHNHLKEIDVAVISTEFKVDKKKAIKNVFSQLFASDLRRTTILLTLWMVLSGYGTGSIQVFLPMVIAYYKLPLTGLWSVVMTTTALAIVGYVFAAWLTKRYSAKMVCVVFGTIGGLAGIGLAFFASTIPSITAWYILYYFFNIGLWGAAPGVWTESFPTRVRGTGVSFVTSVAWLGYILTGVLMPPIVSAFNYPGAVFIWTCVAALLPVIFMLGIRTIPAGTELEEIAS